MEAAVGHPAFHSGRDSRLEAKLIRIQKRLKEAVSIIESITEKMETLPHSMPQIELWGLLKNLLDCSKE
ncbi:hypothetical protein SD81_021675 [Tolypothrix campylonemoides VB511288]|nr:hypothetical protein SD81_021675 [Tolypothrix campylonemoides VB511288]